MSLPNAFGSCNHIGNVQGAIDKNKLSANLHELLRIDFKEFVVISEIRGLNF